MTECFDQATASVIVGIAIVFVVAGLLYVAERLINKRNNG